MTQPKEMPNWQLLVSLAMADPSTFQRIEDSPLFQEALQRMDYGTRARTRDQLNERDSPTASIRQEWDEHVLIKLGDVRLYVINRPDEFGHVVVKRADNIVGVLMPTDPACIEYETPMSVERRTQLQVGIDEEFDE